ncbi:hypothetical protein M8C21_013291 [Ambrosia artemisiifolia]|uniref:FK506-binding protein n=1 Tax=Ambrosia artemisiifolia TaxID=4212 RepID=A0AAD5GAK2_AMBAR|nr:hypothetical protein M8C21_013291 [Ambrosia artemisiifolia]
MAFWGVELKPGKPYLHQYDDEKGRLHLSQATLGGGKSKEKAVVVCNVGDKKPIYLCSLLPRKMETCSLNIEFEEYDEVTFSVEGPHSIHLSGFFYGEETNSDNDDYESDSGDDGIFEGAEIDSGDDSEFDFDSEDEDDLTDNEMDMLPSSNITNGGVRIEEIVDDEKPNENAVSKQAKKNKQASNNADDNQQQIVLKSSSSVPVLESEDEDGFPISSAANDKDNIPTVKKVTEESNKKGKAKRKNEVNDSENKAKRKKDDSVVGHDDHASQPVNVEVPTPESDVKKSKKKNKKAQETREGANSNNGVQKEETNQKQTPEKVASLVKDTNKNKQQENKLAVKVNGSATEAKVRTFPSGLVIEEIQMGKPNGKRADPGKKISMRYIGKLKKNGKIFDSNIGKAPFKFRLGAGQVIAGWDVGVKGMRVGEKRRLTIPPAMGYGTKGAGSAIPPNSWLVFDVELVDVN